VQAFFWLSLPRHTALLKDLRFSHLSPSQQIMNFWFFYNIESF